MIRCTIEMIPKGDESRKRVMGLIEIANIGGTDKMGNYTVRLFKTPPFSGALVKSWKSGRLPVEGDDAPIVAGEVIGLHRERRGVYDLLFRALRVCGLDARN